MNQTINENEIRNSMSSFNWWLLKRQLNLITLRDKIRMFSFKNVIIDLQTKICKFQIERLKKQISSRKKSVLKREYSEDYVKQLVNKIDKQESKIADLEVKLYDKEKEGD